MSKGYHGLTSHVRIHGLALLTLGWIALAVQAAPAGASQLLRVLPGDGDGLARLQAAAPEVNDCGSMGSGDALEFAADDGRAAQLSALGFRVEVVIPDLTLYYASRMETRDNDFGAYHTYPEAIASMDSLAAAHPGIMTPKFSIGTSIEGRPLWVYKISDNPGVDEDEPEIFFNAYIHCREVITFEIVRDLARYLLDGYGSDPRATNLVDTREIFIEPVVNPDGVEYNHLIAPGGGGMWRKNRRDNLDGTWGVDLNRNFEYEWGFDDSGSSPYGGDETYRGEGPFSEPETAAMRDFMNGRLFSSALNYHSYSNLHNFSYGYDDIHHEDYEAFLALGRMRRSYNGYNTGCSWELLYPVNGDANDWDYGEQTTKPKSFGFVTEVGNQSDGFWPQESRIPALVAENREANLRMIELADNPYRILPPGLAVIAAPDTVPTSFSLSWSVPNPDPDNPAVMYNLTEAAGHTVGIDDLEGLKPNRWEADGWTVSTSRSHSPSHSFYSGTNNSLNNVLVSERGHLVRPGERLRFWTWYNIQNGYDYGYLEASVDARHYTPIPGSITTMQDPHNHNLGNGITGNSGGWQQATFDLAAFEGRTLYLRFRYNTDRYTSSEGWYVDDIEPADLFATELSLARGLPATEYTFTGHSEGTFSYLVQSLDAEGDAAIWSAPVDVVVRASTDVAGRSGSAGAWQGLATSGSPFSGSVLLQYQIPSTARAGEPIRLTVHDVTGRTLTSLVEGTVGAPALPGSSLEARWTPEGGTSGLYFARLTVGNLETSRKMVFMR